jgi:hypothetical protein
LKLIDVYFYLSLAAAILAVLDHILSPIALAFDTGPDPTYNGEQLTLLGSSKQADTGKLAATNMPFTCMSDVIPVNFGFGLSIT